MSGYQLILRIKRLEEELHDLGMRWGHDKHGWGDRTEEYLSVFPRDDQLPMYARDAVLFTGTINDLQRWMQGVQWSRGYDMLLKVADDKKRQRKEQDERNRQMVQRIKNEEVEVKNNG